MIYLTCSYPRILISLGSCALACILASLHPYILMFVCTCLYPRILTPSYSQVHVPSPKSLHPRILRFVCAYACNLVSSHPLILRLMYSMCLLVSSHFHVLISLGSCTLGACWYPRILTSSYPYVYVLRVLVGILASSHPYILTFIYSGCLLDPRILISSGSNVRTYFGN